jgi:hypothetical protein
MRQRPRCFQYRPQRLLEFRSGHGRCHLSYEANSPGDSTEFFPVASRHPNRSVCQLMAQDRCDLHWHEIFRLVQIGPDKDLKMPILAALIVPALAYLPAAPAAGRESNRNTQLRRQGSPQPFEHGCHALSDIVQPSLARVVRLSFHAQFPRLKIEAETKLTMSPSQADERFRSRHTDDLARMRMVRVCLLRG